MTRSGDTPDMVRDEAREGFDPDLVWDGVKESFDPELMGPLPDLYVPGTSEEHWQALFDLVARRGWKHEYVEGTTPLAVPSAAHALARPLDAECPQPRVWPTEGMLAIFRFLSDEEIDFDMDLREIQGQDRPDAFCDFLRRLGRHLAKPVVMCPEGANDRPVLGYDPVLDRVRVPGD